MITTTHHERRQLEALDRPALAQHQLGRLNRLLKAILPKNRFYAEKLSKISSAALDSAAGPLHSLDQLQDLPFTFKDELVSSRASGELAANLTFPVSHYTRFHQTSGTRGRPLMVLDTPEDWAWWIDCWQFVLDAAEIEAGERVLMAFSFGPFVGFWSAFDAACARGCLVVPGGGIALDGSRWISSRPAFLLPVRVLGRLFRRLFLTRLIQLYDAGKLVFFGSLASLTERRAFLRHLAPVRKVRWVVYAKAPFAGPEAVLAYLSRYTHRVAISNQRLVAFDETGVTLRYKDYRRDGPERQSVMTLSTDEFIRRFLTHVLPRGFHRIRYYGLLASSSRKTNLARVRAFLEVALPPDDVANEEPVDLRPPCPCCGGHMIIIEAFERWRQPRAPPNILRPIREIAP